MIENAENNRINTFFWANNPSQYLFILYDNSLIEIYDIVLASIQNMNDAGNKNNL